MKGSHDLEQYPKRLLLLMKAWILFIVWDVVSMVEFLWLWANPHQDWDAYISLLRTLERKTSCSSFSCMPCALSSLSAYNELPHEDNKWSTCPSIDKSFLKITPRIFISVTRSIPAIGGGGLFLTVLFYEKLFLLFYYGLISYCY